MFFPTMWILFHKPTGRVSYSLVVTMCTMYILALAHLAVDFQRAIDGFIHNADVARGSLLFYGNLSNATETVKSVLYVLQTFLGDSFVVWRCFVVWGKQWLVMILPVTMLFSTAVVGFGAIHIITKVTPETVVFTSKLYPWITTYFILTLVTNIICTALVAWRIWWSQKALSNAQLPSSLTPVMITVVESGAIYSTALIAVMVAYATKTNGQYAALDFVDHFPYRNCLQLDNRPS